MSVSFDDVTLRIKKIVLRVIGSTVPAEEIGYEQELSVLGVESLNILEIVVQIEQEFAIQIDDSSIFEANLVRVGSLVDLARSHMWLRQ